MPATKGRPDATPQPEGVTPPATDASAARVRQEQKEARRKERGRARTPEAPGLPKPSPRWWAPVMVTLMVIGLLWVVVFYVSGQQWPIAPLGPWNLLVGFALIVVGFLMTTRWT